MVSCAWYHWIVLCENGELWSCFVMWNYKLCLLYMCVCIYSFFLKKKQGNTRKITFFLVLPCFFIGMSSICEIFQIKADYIKSVWYRGCWWVMRWSFAHFSTIPQQQTSCKRSTWCFSSSAEDISDYDMWQIHAAGGFTALRPHTWSSLTMIDRTYCAHFKSWGGFGERNQDGEERKCWGTASWLTSSHAFTPTGRWLTMLHLISTCGERLSLTALAHKLGK